MNEINIHKIDKLNDINYAAWVFKVRLLLKRANVLDVIDGDPPAATAEEEEKAAWIKKDEKAFEIIGLTINDNQLIHIKNLDDSGIKAWKALKCEHSRTSTSGKVRLMKKMFNLKFEGNNMKTHIASIMMMSDRLKDFGTKLEDEMIVAILLGSLDEEYDALVTGLEARNDIQLTFNAVKAKVIDEWERRQFKKVEECTAPYQRNNFRDDTFQN